MSRMSQLHAATVRDDLPDDIDWDAPEPAVTHTTLIRVEIAHEENEIGYPAWLVTPFYKVKDRVVSVPDSRGWPTRHEAEVEAARIRAESRPAECELCGKPMGDEAGDTHGACHDREQFEADRKPGRPL